MPVVIAGGGIGGLAMALTCHQLGIQAVVLESVRKLQPLGVGINLQPNAVRELEELGLRDELDQIGVATQAYNMYSKHGGLIWGEPRGLAAGYKWPQFSVHRGELQMLLYRAAVERLGAEAIRTGSPVVSYEHTKTGVRVSFGRDGNRHTIEGDVLIGADGLNSAVRAQMYPHEGDPIWGGAVLRRAVTKAEPFLDGATMVLCGHGRTKMVSYPISPINPATGEATINWISMNAYDLDDRSTAADYAAEANVEDFLHLYDGWSFAWHDDIEQLIRGAERIYEYPMVDRAPLPRWTDRNATLMGDAAHVMYPVGSNGASQAIVDARKLGRAFLDHGIGANALQAYEAEMRPLTEKMILRNRTAGPDHVMEIVEQRCGGDFDDIDEVMSLAERQEFAAGYKSVAGFAIAELNASDPIIPPGAQISGPR